MKIIDVSFELLAVTRTAFRQLGAHPPTGYLTGG